MTDRELMQQALEALESAKYGMAECRQEIGFDFANEQYDVEQAITALRERLAQPEQEPVAWFDKEFNSVRWRANLRNCDLADQQPLYTAPPRREWVGLTEEDIDGVKHTFDWASPWTLADYARAIEAKLKEKNA